MPLVSCQESIPCESNDRRREGAQTSIVQNLSYFEHLAEPMAELLHILAEQYDYPQLTDEILRFVHFQCLVTLY